MAPSSRNPFGFGPYVVTFFTTVVYTGLLAALIVTHHILPPAPSSPTPTQWPGVNMTQAWHDLEHLSSAFHPFNSRNNVDVRKWLLSRLAHILDANKVEWKEAAEHSNSSLPVTVFDRDLSNVTYTDSRGFSVYYESDNLMVYVRGTADPKDEWWLKPKKYNGPGGVLVNAHYDSVSTGFGATDDGVGVVTVLQLLSHFSNKENQPYRGILFLLNNGEEDGLYGAKAFTRHPLAQFPRTFLNLEGAGAGGRATLFRSTDTEVTRFYSNSPHPFGSVVSGDGFKRGVVRSGTDYSVFSEDLNMRGLDVAFMEPRARYHTNQDDTKDTSVESVWHMLSAALTTVQGLSSDTSDEFERPADDDQASGSTGVWFDLFGRVFAVFQLHTLFALSVTLLVAGPVFLILLDIVLHKTDKWYLFSRKRFLHSSDDDAPVKLYGWRGFFRFPLIFILTSGIVFALAYLLNKVNPHIVYSSEYAVWSMMLSAWLSIAWFFFRLGDAVRPSALSRAYVLIWLYAISWLGLVAATIGESRLHLASGYFLIIYNAALLAALLISYLEFFALPKKSVYVEQVTYASHTALPSPERSGSIISHSIAEHDDAPRGRAAIANDNDDADERTSLLGSRQTFTRLGRDRRRSDDHGDVGGSSILEPSTTMSQPYQGEQGWSGSLPSSVWLLQFLILAPINLIVIGQLALLMTSALHQTPADGNPVFIVYLLMAAMSILLLLPLTPFIHRITYHIPTLLIFIFTGTLIYNLVAFPFSRQARLKVFFLQQLDLDHGNTTVALTGLSPYLESIVSHIPSASSNGYTCNAPDYSFWAFRAGLDSCSWTGPAPNVVPKTYSPHHPSLPFPNATTSLSSLALARRQAQVARYTTWLDYNITRPLPSDNASTHLSYTFDIRGTNTRSCRLYLSVPYTNVSISNAGPSAPSIPSRRPGSSQRIYLYSRSWDATWRVNVTFARKDVEAFDGGAAAAAAVQGRVVCVWSDVNALGLVPAFDELRHFMPVWSAVTKNGDGLVEGYKGFVL
jgi:hypothetical protein